MEKVKKTNLFNCFGCPKIFPSSQDVGFHVKEEHSFECEQCNKIMASKSALNDHMEEHIINVKVVEKAQYFDELSQMCNQLQEQLNSDCDTSYSFLSDNSLDENIKVINVESYLHQGDSGDAIEESFCLDVPFSDFSSLVKEEHFVDIERTSNESDVGNFYYEGNTDFISQNINYANMNVELQMETLMKKHDWSHKDPTVPLGWMTAWDKILKEKRFLSPKGKFFSSRVDAIFYMAQQGTEETQIKEMKEGLLDDGWNIENDLPEGWFVRKADTGDQFIYFTDENILLKSTKSASEFLEQSDKYGKFEIDNLWRMSSLDNSSHQNNKVAEWIRDKQMVPKGWYRKVKNISDIHRKVHFKTEKGETIVGTISALQYMVQNSYSDEDIALVKLNLLEDGWRREDFLPEGWFIKNRRKGRGPEYAFNFLTNEFRKFESFKMVGEALKNFGPSGMEAYQKIFLGLEELRKSFRKKITIGNEGGYKLPAGWQLKINKRADTSHMYHFVLPNGTKTTGLVNTLKHMLTEKYSSNDIELIINYLKQEGWTSDALLPNGWYMKKNKKNKKYDSSFKFITEDFQYLGSNTNALNHLENNEKYTKEATKNFTKLIKQMSIKGSEDRWNWSKGHEAVPNGWKIRSNSAPNSNHFVISPNGMKFVTLRKALRYMHEENSSKQDIELMAKHLTKEGWETHELLPNGWHMKPSRSESDSTFKFLSGDFQYHKSNTTALYALQTSEHSTVKEVENFKDLLKQLSLKGSKDRWNWSQDITEVPNGWKVMACPTNDQKHFVIAPNGTRFDAIRLALKYMVEINYNDNDVELLAKHLIKERWEQDEKIPAGWYFKRITSSKLVNFEFLTINFKLISSIKSVLEYLENSNLYDQETIKLFLEKIEEERLCARKKSFESDGTKDLLPNGWKMRTVQRKDGRIKRFFLSCDGNNFNGVIQALQYMAKTNYNSGDLEVLSLYLIKDGWNSDELLPKGWYMKSESSSKGSSFRYLTDKFESIPTNTTALDFIKNSGEYTTLDEQNFVMLLGQKSLKSSNERWAWTEDCDTVPYGWKIRSCPTNDKRHFVKSPDNVQFVTFRQALQYMVKNNYSEKDIEVMAQHLTKEGWESHEALPTGWYMKPESYAKKGQFNYLTHVFEFIRSNTAALDTLKNNGSSTKDDVQRFMEFLKYNSTKESEERWNWNKGNEIIPAGWKMRECPTDKRRNFVISPTGIKFETIRKTLEYMVKNGSSTEDIDIMAKHIPKEGWEKHELLPNGWHMKSIRKGKFYKLNFLSDAFKPIDSNTGALDDLRNN